MITSCSTHNGSLNPAESMEVLMLINLNNNCKFFLANIAEYENFFPDKYENAKLAEKIHAQQSGARKKFYNLGSQFPPNFMGRFLLKRGLKVCSNDHGH